MTLSIPLTYIEKRPRQVHCVIVQISCTAPVTGAHCIFTLLQVFTVEFGGTKRVVISGYHVMQDILVKQADNSSLRTTNSLPKSYTKIAKKHPGNLRISSFSQVLAVVGVYMDLPHFYGIGTIS